MIQYHCTWTRFKFVYFHPNVQDTMHRQDPMPCPRLSNQWVQLVMKMIYQIRFQLAFWVPWLCTFLLLGSNTSQLIVIVCERSDVFASGCAVARVFPTFTRKTVSKAQEYTPDANVPKVLNHNVQVAFIIVDENNGGLTDNDVETLTQSASAIQLASRIVDTPCNEMHTDGYVTV